MIKLTAILTLFKFYINPVWKLTYHQNYSASSPYKLKQFEHTVMISIPNSGGHSYYIFER